MGWGVTFWDGVVGNGLGCYFPGWGGSVRNGMLLSGVSVSIWDRVLVNGIVCSFIGCVSKWDEMFV